MTWLLEEGRERVLLDASWLSTVCSGVSRLDSSSNQYGCVDEKTPSIVGATPLASIYGVDTSELMSWKLSDLL